MKKIKNKKGVLQMLMSSEFIKAWKPKKPIKPKSKYIKDTVVVPSWMLESIN